MIYIHVRINAAGMHAVLGHQIYKVYLTGLSAQSDVIFSADLCMAIVPCIYRLIFFPELFFLFYAIFLYSGWGFGFRPFGFSGSGCYL